MCVKKIHQFLSSIKKDAHKRKVIPLFLPHNVDLCPDCVISELMHAAYSASCPIVIK